MSLRFLTDLLGRHHGVGCVVILDEYDAPLLNVVHDPEALERFRDVMREFYAPLKACDEDLEFVFITGITKFSQLSIFSELNNMRNISMDPRYAAICGITEEELVTQMEASIQAFAAQAGLSEEAGLAVLKKNYDGYHFTAPSPDIYNPFSLLSALESGNPKAYWFETGTPTFLLELLKRYRWDMTTLQDCEAPEDSFDAAAEDLGTPLPMLYQGGYLTIKDYDPYSQTYSLGIPNTEVSRGLSKCFVRTAAPEALLDHHSYLTRVSRALRAGDLESALQATRSYLAGIPYHLGSRDERGFETTFYLIFDLLGIQIETEFKTATGRADAVVTTPERLYVLEFKYDGTAQKALDQIGEKGYLVPFEADGRTLVKAGVNFSSAEQTIDEWIIEEG